MSKFEFKYSIEDFRTPSGKRWSLRRPFARWALLILVWMILSLIAFVGGGVYLGIEVALPWIFVGLVPPLYVALFVYRGLKKADKRPSLQEDWDRSQLAHETIVVELAPDEFRFLTSKWRHKIKWHAFREVLETGDAFEFSYSNETRLVPKRIFTDSNTLDEFRKSLKDRCPRFWSLSR